MKPKLAFVVVGWNNQHLLDDCLKSLAQQTHGNSHIIYIDNASSDNSVNLVRKNYPNTTVILQPQNFGFAKANNIGIMEALKDPEVKYVGLINSDSRLASDWCETIINFAEIKPRGACFQGTTLDFYKPDVIDSTHIYVAQNGQGTQGNWRRYYVADIGPKKVFGTNAAACIISRRFIESQPFGENFFDGHMFMYLEDVDVAARATVMGWDNYLVPHARAYHMGSASSSKNPGFSLYMTFRNNSAMLYKNFPLKLIFRMMPMLIRGDIDTIRTLRRLQKKGAISKVVKGRLVGIARLPFFIPARMRLRKYSQIDPEYLWALMKKGY